MRILVFPIHLKESLQTSSSTAASAEPKRVYCQECGRQFAQKILAAVGIDTYALEEWVYLDGCHLPRSWHAKDLQVGARILPPSGLERSRFRGMVRQWGKWALLETYQGQRQERVTPPLGRGDAEPREHRGVTIPPKMSPPPLPPPPPPPATNRVAQAVTLKAAPKPSSAYQCGMSTWRSQSGPTVPAPNSQSRRGRSRSKRPQRDPQESKLERVGSRSSRDLHRHVERADRTRSSQSLPRELPYERARGAAQEEYLHRQVPALLMRAKVEHPSASPSSQGQAAAEVEPGDKKRR